MSGVEGGMIAAGTEDAAREGTAGEEDAAKGVGSLLSGVPAVVLSGSVATDARLSL